MTGPDGYQVSYTYDADGRQLTATTPSGTTHYAYDARGNPVSVTDPTEAMVTLSYDAADRLTAQTDADGGVWRTSYDAVGNAIATTDATGGTSSYVFTPAPAGGGDRSAGPADQLQLCRHRAGHPGHRRAGRHHQVCL